MWGPQADKLFLGALAILSSPALALKPNTGSMMDYFIMVFHNDVITPAFLNRSTWSSRKFCIQAQPETLLISIFLNEPGPLVLWEQGAQVNCPIHLFRYGAWLIASPFPCEHQLRLFARLLVQFHSEKPLQSGAKGHMLILPQAANNRKASLTPFSSTHLWLSRSYIHERNVSLHCLCGSPPLASVRNTTD